MVPFYFPNKQMLLIIVYIQLSNDNIEISDIFIKCCQQLIYQGWLKPEI